MHVHVFCITCPTRYIADKRHAYEFSIEPFYFKEMNGSKVTKRLIHRMITNSTIRSTEQWLQVNKNCKIG